MGPALETSLVGRENRRAPHTSAGLPPILDDRAALEEISRVRVPSSKEDLRGQASKSSSPWQRQRRDLASPKQAPRAGVGLGDDATARACATKAARWQTLIRGGRKARKVAVPGVPGTLYSLSALLPLRLTPSHSLSPRFRPSTPGICCSCSPASASCW